MEPTIFRVDPNTIQKLPVKVEVSFRPFLQYLESHSETSGGLKSKIYRFIAKKLRQSPVLLQPIKDLNVLKEYQDELELVESTVFPLSHEESEEPFALCTPLTPEFFYMSTGLVKLLKGIANGSGMGLRVGHETMKLFEARKEWMLYEMILNRLYDFPVQSNQEMIFPLYDEATTLTRYMRIEPELRFVEIRYKGGQIPVLSLSELAGNSFSDETVGVLREQLPLEQFEIEGFAILSFKDVTSQQAVENLKNVLVGMSDLADAEVFDYFREGLRTLVGNANLKIGLIPLLMVNDEYVMEPDNVSQSIISIDCESHEDACTFYENMAPDTAAFNKPLIYPRLPKDPDNSFFNILRGHGLASYMALPIRFKDRPVGLLELACNMEGSMNASVLSRLEHALPLVGQLLDTYIDRFEARIDEVIKEKFTSVQPIVEWKFNEVAWDYIQARSNDPKASIGRVAFEQVYPFYGAVDVRNSTRERNQALSSDYATHLQLLTDIFSVLQTRLGAPMFDQLFKVKQWKQQLERPLTTEEEVQINIFLEEEMLPFLQQYRLHHHQEVRAVVGQYFDALDPEEGAFHAHRREFENSLQMLNTAIAGLIDDRRRRLSKKIPVYFEKYRTDGIEYNIFLGESLTPTPTFRPEQVQELRQWQLETMAAVIQLTHELMPQLPLPLQTTQLVLAQHHPIDISFRRDERRFDVEGGYNIRYEIMKKRVDKVAIKDTGERLTQPGTIAIVYSNLREGEAYGAIIESMQEQGLLLPHTEQLQLEETQGFVGLRALRVAVRTNPN